MVLNDDQVIQTPGWDRILLDMLAELRQRDGHGLHILHWRDGINDAALPQGFATEDLLSITDTFYPVEAMRHLFVDNYFRFIGRIAGLLEYVPEVFIEHLHYCNGKAPMDKNYAQTNSQSAYDRDGQAFEEWCLKSGYALAGKINEARGWIVHCKNFKPSSEKAAV
jgi:hypothetical protein